MWYCIELVAEILGKIGNYLRLQTSHKNEQVLRLSLSICSKLSLKTLKTKMTLVNRNQP